MSTASARRGAARGNPNQYLRQIRATWYVSIKVPRPLQKAVGNTHIRQSLHTKDINHANHIKHAVVAIIKARLTQLQQEAASAATQHTGTTTGLTFADAAKWREELSRLATVGDDDMAEVIRQHAAEKAEQIEALYGFPKAKKWHTAATRTTPSLSELLTKWHAASDYRESTKAGHRKALAGVLANIKDNDATPQDINRKVALSYIDEELTQQGLAHATIRDRLASLTAFWGWLESRAVVPQGHNPWTGHKISKTAHKGRGKTKRAFTKDEIIALLKGTEQARKWPTWSYLPDLIILGLYSACRIEELCSLKASDIEIHDATGATGACKQAGNAVILNIAKSKTQAGIRPVALTHPAALAVIHRRLKGASLFTGATQAVHIFHELKPGGLDKKHSFSAVKAFGRYRRECGVPDGTDFHSFRRLAITALEQQNVRQVLISRFAGHKVGTLAADTYSSGGSKAQSVETSRHLVYGGGVDEAARALAQC